MINNKPTVSIILPVHNSEKHLNDCLQSLVSQTYRNLEVIAIDDQSSDRSYKILKEFAKKYKRLRVYRNIKRYGIAVTLNRLIKKSKGSFIAFMDQNDITNPKRIRKQVEFLLNNPEVVVIGSQCVFISSKNRRLRKSEFPEDNKLIYQSPLHGISMQFETVLINTNLIPKDLLKFKIGNSNHFIYSDLLMKLLPYGKFANLPQYLHSHRNDPKTYFSDLRVHIVSLIKLWITSITNYEYQLSVKSFFTPLIKKS